jgi:hypothetical protein
MAMVLNETPEYLISVVGHDGSEIYFPEKPEPYNRRSFMVEEFLNHIYSDHYIAMPFPRIADYAGRVVNLVHSPPLQHKGILIYGNHAVAWNGEKIHDPVGKIYDLKTQWDIFWMIERAFIAY